jgi:hypothetical protein
MTAAKLELKAKSPARSTMEKRKQDSKTVDAQFALNANASLDTPFLNSR